MAPIVASWGPAAQRVLQYLQGAPIGPQQVVADIAVVRESCLAQHPAWRRDLIAAERKLRERQSVVAVPVRRHYTPDESRERRLRHERNAAARAEANRQMAKLGGKKQK